MSYKVTAFTLVEIAVVVCVLSVLTTISFTSVANVSLNARNSARLTNMVELHQSLDLYSAQEGSYPVPDNKTDVYSSGVLIGYQ